MVRIFFLRVKEEEIVCSETHRGNLKENERNMFEKKMTN